MWQQYANWDSIPIKQQISVLKPQEMHQIMLLVVVFLLSSFQEKTDKPKNIPPAICEKIKPWYCFLLLKYFCWHDHPFQMDCPKKGNGEASPRSLARPAPPTCSGCLCVPWCSPWVCPACGSMFGISCLSFLLVFPCAWWLPKSCWCVWKSKRWFRRISFMLNKCLNSNISLQILRRGGENFPHKVKNTEYWIGILNPSGSLGVLQEQGVMSWCCSRP